MSADNTPAIAGPRPLQQDDIDRKIKEFDSVPLFMKSLPESEDAAAPSLDALQSLIYEGTPDEIAQNFKEQGNDYFKGKRYREALGFYTQGLDAKPQDSAILEALLCNRAACNLELQNYGSVLKDCSRALTINPRSSKAYYRSALALLALDKLEEALDCCDRCLAYDRDNKGVQGVREKVSRKKEEKDRREREKAEKMRKEREEKMKMRKALEERHIFSVHDPDAPPNPYEPHFDPEDPSGKTLIFPVFFLYPQYATSDIVPTFVEDTPFSLHISTMFPPNAPPPEWDKKGEYVDGNLVIYGITRRKRLLKVGKKMSLKDLFAAAQEKPGEEKDGLELKDGCVTVVILPKGDEEKKWVEEFKRNRAS
ncbi:TPR-like protein [Gloeophyllum trabeum ATCC 11539]|uniref:TPR-like protein n=1 Tax=Gloeophyllum trabeum (strain ATCC 11539 / FP-39264 / Madison 617) TaxID=670483 RepID=S7RXI7_GLOTA|nr:TPR-like protein [Gloeophyllum trabeum ATCC 11539]EPQ59635.1 TPR-like protein [Gloeophyllum trabeum ATCC 11539]